MHETTSASSCTERWLLTVKLTPIGMEAYRAPGASARVGPAVFGNRILACSREAALKEAEGLVSSLSRIAAGGLIEAHAVEGPLDAPVVSYPFRDSTVSVQVVMHYWVAADNPLGAVKLYRQVQPS